MINKDYLKALEIAQKAHSGQNRIFMIKQKMKHKCENCNEEEVEHQGDWCDDCNLPERSPIK